jgi:D-alanyl-D-alanine carboxypeptidase (penicillin-binding protein 5/6)
MAGKNKIILTAFVLSLPFWWGVNLLEKNLNDFLFWYQISRNPEILTANLTLYQKLNSLKPFLKGEAENLELNAQSAISFLIKRDGQERILFEKDIEKKLPVASLTKLMTTKLVLDNYDLEKEITVSRKAVEQEEDFGKLQIGRVFPVKYLLYPLLMESSNDAAYSLANDYDGMTEKEFVSLMNREAERLGLADTSFVNTTGLDPEDWEPKNKINISTVSDLVKLTKTLLPETLIWKILSTPEYSFYGPELTNTNQLLTDDTIEWRDKIIGGKTGYTEMAGGCFLLVTEAPDKGTLINIILGTENTDARFKEMEKLVNWLNKAYQW